MNNINAYSSSSLCWQWNAAFHRALIRQVLKTSRRIARARQPPRIFFLTRIYFIPHMKWTGLSRMLSQWNARDNRIITQLTWTWSNKPLFHGDYVLYVSAVYLLEHVALPKPQVIVFPADTAAANTTVMYWFIMLRCLRTLRTTNQGNKHAVFSLKNGGGRGGTEVKK